MDIMFYSWSVCLFIGLRKLLPLINKSLFKAHWGAPVKLHTDGGNCFTGQVLQHGCAIWPALHFHRAYHTQSLSFIETANGLSESQLAKFVEFFI